MFKWGSKVREGSIKAPEPPAREQVLCYKSFGLEEPLGECPVCAAVEKAAGEGGELAKLAKKVKPVAAEIFQVIDMGENQTVGKFTPQVFYASPKCFNQIRAIINKTAVHGTIWHPTEGSVIEIDFRQGETTYDNDYIVRCETNLMLKDGDYRKPLPPIDEDRIVNIEEDVYSTVLSPEAMAELLKGGNVINAKKAGGVVNLKTGEIEMVKFDGSADAADTKRIKFFNMKPGINRLRILPPVEDDGVFSVEIKRHFEVGLLPQITGNLQLPAGSAAKLSPDKFKSGAQVAETRGVRQTLAGTKAADKAVEEAAARAEKAAEDDAALEAVAPAEEAPEEAPEKPVSQTAKAAKDRVAAMMGKAKAPAAEEPAQEKPTAKSLLPKRGGSVKIVAQTEVAADTIPLKTPAPEVKPSQKERALSLIERIKAGSAKK